jgi:hypothetical protein
MVNRFALRALALAILMGCVQSCASTAMLDLTGEEQASMTLAMATPLSFAVPRDRSMETWDRAQTFLDRYSTMTLRTSTDSLLQRYDPPRPYQQPGMETTEPIRFGYSFSRAAFADSIRITVGCKTNRDIAESDADKNAHIAAYFVLTGRIACARCIVR